MKKADKKKFISIAVGVVVLAVLAVILWIIIAKPVFMPLVDKQIIKESDYTYTDEPIGNIEYIVIHYVANPGSTAQANRNYFNNLATTEERRASAHYVIGLDGEIIQCVPLDRAPFANGDEYYNSHSISIECCHPKADGEFNEKTKQSLAKLVRWLCYKYNVTEDRIIRHYDVSGKNCPKFYVEHEDEWTKLKESFLK